MMDLLMLLVLGCFCLGTFGLLKICDLLMRS